MTRGPAEAGFATPSSYDSFIHYTSPVFTGAFAASPFRIFFLALRAKKMIKEECREIPLTKKSIFPIIVVVNLGRSHKSQAKSSRGISMKHRGIFSIFFSAIFLILILILGGCSGGGGDSGGTINLAWDAPTTNVDGSHLDDLLGYYIYYRKPGESYTTTNRANANLNDLNYPTYSLKDLNLPPGEYYFVVTAYDTDGNESGYSNEVPVGNPLPIPP